MLHLREKPLELPELRSRERGELLLFDPDGTAFDGAALLASEEYFDDHNEPPWNTWVGYVWDDATPGGPATPFWSCLVAWVPTAYIPFCTARNRSKP